MNDVDWSNLYYRKLTYHKVYDVKGLYARIAINVVYQQNYLKVLSHKVF